MKISKLTDCLGIFVGLAFTVVGKFASKTVGSDSVSVNYTALSIQSGELEGSTSRSVPISGRKPLHWSNHDRKELAKPKDKLSYGNPEKKASILVYRKVTSDGPLGTASDISRFSSCSRRNSIKASSRLEYLST